MQRQLKLQEQVKLTAHQKKLVLGNFHYTIESLEEYIEKTGYYPDFKDKKQIFKESINDASRTSAELADDFLTQLLCFKAIVDNKPDFFKEEIKEEFYKWINAVGINVKNCPNELRHYLFEINEILEGRGEKIVEQTRELIEGAEIDPRDLVKVVGVLQKPLNDNREQGKSLEGKTYRDIEIESKFNGDAKQGDIAFNQMAWDFNHDYFDFFPELAKKKRQRAIDDYLEGEREEEEKENHEAIKKRKITDEARKAEQQVKEQTEVEVNSEKLVQEQAEAEEKDKQHNPSEKTKNNLNNNLNQAQSSDATVEDKVQVIKDLGKIHGEEGFEEQQKQIKVIMDELGRTNPPKLVEGLVGTIEENLKKNKLTIEELDSQTQADYQNIKDNQDKVDKINETIGKTGARKRFGKLKTKLSKVAKFSQAQVKKLKEKLSRFICSKNKHDQPYQTEARQLLKQLEENCEQKQLNSKNEPSTVEVGRIMIGGGLLAAVGLIGTWCSNWLK